MGMVFQLGHNDHKVAEDFLLRRPAGVEGITLHAKAARYQQAAAEAAAAAGAGVAAHRPWPDPTHPVRQDQPEQHH